MDCKELFAAVVQLAQEREQDANDLKNPDSGLTQQEKDALEQKIKNEDAQLVQLQTQFSAQGCITPKKQPQGILEIRFVNPTHPDSLDGLSAQNIAFGQENPTPVIGGTFPSSDAKQEWKQVLAPGEDYEGSNLVGFTGWALDPDFSNADVPFNHPFDFDWEMLVALD